MTNMYEVIGGVEYELVLQTRDLLFKTLSEQVEKWTSQILDQADEIVKYLTVRLIEDTLSNWKPDEYDEFIATPFAKQIFKSFCDEFPRLDIHFRKIQNEAPYLSQFILLDEYEWDDLDVLNILFPNVKVIQVKNISLCTKVLEDILRFMLKEDSKVQGIVISEVKTKIN